MSQTTVSYISDDSEEFQPMTPPEGLPECSVSSDTQPSQQTPSTHSFTMTVVSKLRFGK